MGLLTLRRKRGSAPQGYIPINLVPDYPQHFYQVKQTYPWPPAPAHETRAALSNCWMGNQMPGYINFIPGVAHSKFVWNVPTSYANTLKNSQFNSGFNIQGMSAVQSASLMQQIQQAWQNRAQ